MLYLSTRGDPKRRRFCEILLEGLAPDGGLYLPEHYPQVDESRLTVWRRVWQEQGYADLAFEVLSLYIDDIPAEDLRALCRKTYTREVFGSEEIVPLRRLEGDLFIEALSNGPTLAFKDMAMQLLGHLFEYELTRRGEQLNILGATSGDTGSAAEYAMRGKRGVRVFMTSPQGRMSPFQQAQMFSLLDPNIHNIAIEGVFDDCQDLVKAVSNDLAFKRRHRIGTVNSINWARLLAQVVYYFAGYFQATTHNAQRVSFCVPSGNFGNVCAGHVARQMRLPIDHWWWPPTKTTCSMSFSVPGCIGCAIRPTPSRPPVRPWTFPKPAISSVLSLTCWVVTLCVRRSSLARPCLAQGRLTCMTIPRLLKPSRAMASRVVAAPMPTV